MTGLSKKGLIRLLTISLLLNGCGILGVSDEYLHLLSKDPVFFELTDLDYIKQQLQKENSIYEKAYTNLIVAAHKALNSNGYSVTYKNLVAPNGDENAFVSRGRYWWPNPDTENGLPYVHRDGQVNPEIYQFDYFSLSRLKGDIQTLSITYYLTAQEEYAEKAISLIRTWFIAKETKMRPHLKFAQSIPGHSFGRPEGIIDGLDFYRILNYITILRKSTHWTDEINRGINSWYYKYYIWLLNHPLGKAAKNKTNNHGTWYDVQVGIYAYFFDDQATLEEVLYRVQEVRIPEQIGPGGRQINELSRSNPISYSIYNLKAFSILAKLADKSFIENIVNPYASVSSKSYGNSNYESIENAIRFLLPFLNLNDNSSLNYEAISEYNLCSVIPILKWAYDYYKKEEYYNTYHFIIEKELSCRESKNLILYPIKKQTT